MNSRRQMESALKQIVVSELRSRGFTGSFPHLRRIRDTAVDLLTFQFDRNGGGFLIEIAQSKPEGFTTYWGKHIPTQKLTAWDLHPNDRKRIQPENGAGTESWFRFDGRTTSDEVAISVLAGLREAEEFWNDERNIG